jgi:hypothetical protein
MKPILLFLALSLAAGASAQVTNGLVASYSFDNGNGNDNIGSNHAKVVGATLATDRFGNPNKAYYLNGTPNSYLNLGTSATLKPSTGSICVWVSIDTISAGGSGYSYNPIILTKNDSVSSYFEGYSMYYSPDDNAFITISTEKGTTNEAYTLTSGPVPMDTWQHLVITFDDDTLKYYVNGQLDKAIYKGFTSEYLQSDSVMVGNSANTLNNRFLKGSVDGIRIYNRVLSSAEVDSIYSETDAVTGISYAKKSDYRSCARILPDPATGGSMLVADRPLARIDLFNTWGQVVQSVPASGLKAGLPTSSLATGLYIVRAVFADNSSCSQKLLRR